MPGIVISSSLAILSKILCGFALGNSLHNCKYLLQIREYFFALSTSDAVISVFMLNFFVYLIVIKNFIVILQANYIVCLNITMQI